MENTVLNTGMATSNPQANVNQVQPNSAVPNTTQGNQINPITIPIQIQPQVTTTGNSQTTSGQVNGNLQANPASQSQATAPTPQPYQGNNQSNNVIDFNQIYSAYQNQYGNTYNNSNTYSSGIKKTSIGTTIVTPKIQNLNSVQGQYQSAYSDTINSVISTLLSETQSLKNGFNYDPSQDMSLRIASEYAANSTLQSLAGSGVLNSSATSERVARIVSELIPQYEKLAYDRQLQYLNQLANTAELVMNYDTQQFQYWKDAKDREFQEKEFEYKKSQDELENAWKRVDELGYVDNKSSAILGVKVGTLSGKAREAKEEREYELNKMREQYQLEYNNNVAIARVKAELELQTSKELADYNAKIEKSLYSYKSNIDTSASKELANYNANLDKSLYSYKSNIDTNANKELAKYKTELDTAASKELAAYQNSLNNSSKEYEYQLAQKYGATTSKSNSSTVSLTTYKDIIKNAYTDYDSLNEKYVVNDNASLWDYLTSEYVSGRMTENDYVSLIAMYGVTEPTDSDRARSERIKYLKSLEKYE